MGRIVIVTLALSGLALATGCREEGPAERAGRQIDEAVEEARESTEGTLEKLGREVDEAVEETEEAAKEIGEAARKADGG